MTALDFNIGGRRPRERDREIEPPERMEIITGIDGRRGVCLIEPDTFSIGLCKDDTREPRDWFTISHDGIGPLCNWFTDRSIGATLIGPYFTQFHLRIEDRPDLWAKQIGIAWKVEYRCRIRRDEDEVRCIETLVERRKVLPMVWNQIVNRYQTDNHPEIMEWTRSDMLERVHYLCGGLPGDQIERIEL